MSNNVQIMRFRLIYYPIDVFHPFFIDTSSFAINSLIKLFKLNIFIIIGLLWFIIYILVYT